MGRRLRRVQVDAVQRGLRGDPKKLAIAGESAGGGLAVATAIAVRDAGLQAPLHVLSVYPIPQTSLDTPSYKERAKAKPLNRDMMKWFLDQTISSQADLKDPRSRSWTPSCRACRP